jgi:hypothetical protein
MPVSACSCTYQALPYHERAVTRISEPSLHLTSCCEEFGVLHFVCKVLAGLCRAGLGSSVLSTSPSDLSARILLTHLEANYFASSPVSVANT